MIFINNFILDFFDFIFIKFIKLFTNKNFLFCISEIEELSESPSVEISFSESLKSRLSKN